MSRPVLLLTLGADPLPNTTPVVPVLATWAVAVYVPPAVQVPGSFAVTATVDGMVVTWAPISSGGALALDRAPDVAGAPGAWAEVTRSADTTYSIAITGGTRLHWRARAFVFSRSSAYTAIVSATALTAASPADIAAQAQASAAAAAALAQQIVDERAARQTAIAAAQRLITQITDDSILSPDEKPALIRELQLIINERPGILLEAAASEAVTQAADYDTAVNTLVSYLATLITPVAWNNTSGNTALN